MSNSRRCHHCRNKVPFYHDDSDILPIYSNHKLALMSMNVFSDNRREIYRYGFGINIRNRLMEYFTSSDIERPRPFIDFEPIVHHVLDERYIPSRVTNIAFWHFVTKLHDLHDDEIRKFRFKLDWNYMSSNHPFTAQDAAFYQDFIDYERFVANEYTANTVKSHFGYNRIDRFKSKFHDRYQLLECMSREDFRKNIHWIFINFNKDLIMRKIKRLYRKELHETDIFHVDTIYDILFDDLNRPKLTSLKI